MEVAERPAARAGQRALAQELTEMVHGAQALAAVEAASRALFGSGELREVPEATLDAALRETRVRRARRPDRVRRWAPSTSWWPRGSPPPRARRDGPSRRAVPRSTTCASPTNRPPSPTRTPSLADGWSSAGAGGRSLASAWSRAECPTARTGPWEPKEPTTWAISCSQARGFDRIRWARVQFHLPTAREERTASKSLKGRPAGPSQRLPEQRTCSSLRACTGYNRRTDLPGRDAVEHRRPGFDSRKRAG